MKREIIATKDGSKTIHLPEWRENYHSHHGAVQEAQHVFIQAGLEFIGTTIREVSILEIGFGTGLNAILSYIYAKRNKLKLHYHGVEAYPVNSDELEALAYAMLPELMGFQNSYYKLHTVPQNTDLEMDECFSLSKHLTRIQEIDLASNQFDLIYFDAFGPRVQPELWTLPIFENMYRMMKVGGVLVTYCAKGDVRRAMLNAGFSVEKIPGPPGKREMLRAAKK
jgi:tRNA U34 5-methylaminomethyl-2-thiouridine-forming methyltransferase MnmC